MRKTAIVALLLACSAGCGTEEVGPNPLIQIESVAGPDNGEVWWVFPPPSQTFEEGQARAARAYGAQYFVFLDGKQLAFVHPQDGRLYPASISEGASGSVGFLPSGTHQFAVVAAGGPTVFTGETEIVPGFVTRMYLFGRLDALRGRFISYPVEPPPGMLHVDVTNLVRDGRSLEVVSCANASDCVAVSPPLAEGEHFGADFPSADGQPYALAGGRWIGWRQLPTAAAAAPPVQQITWDIVDPAVARGGPAAPPPNFATAPLYLSPDGAPLSVF